VDFASLWDDLAELKAPVMLVRGGRSLFVHDDDQKKMEELQPAARIERVDEAGHSVQSDRPVILAGLIAAFVASTP
jgi:pimeloyl-ACP methyl ester carboxylesterase